MSFVAVAIGGSALIGGVTSVISGNKAAGAVKDSAAATNETNRYIYDTTRADNAPYRQVGNAALGKLADMYGVGTGGGTDWNAYVEADPAAKRDWQLYHSGGVAVNGVTPDTMSEAEYGQYHYRNDGAQRDLTPYKATNNYGGFETSPGYQFRLDEGMKAIERSAAARGGLNSGATMKALNRYAQGTASSEYENYANRLAALAGVGQNANSSNAQAGQAFASGTAQTNAAAGNATASAYQNTGNAINSGVQNLTSAYLYNKGYGGGGGFGGGTSYNVPGYGNA